MNFFLSTFLLFVFDNYVNEWDRNLTWRPDNPKDMSGPNMTTLFCFWFSFLFLVFFFVFGYSFHSRNRKIQTTYWKVYWFQLFRNDKTWKFHVCYNRGKPESPEENPQTTDQLWWAFLCRPKFAKFLSLRIWPFCRFHFNIIHDNFFAFFLPLTTASN